MLLTATCESCGNKEIKKFKLNEVMALIKKSTEFSVGKDCANLRFSSCKMCKK